MSWATAALRRFYCSVVLPGIVMLNYLGMHLFISVVINNLINRYSLTSNFTMNEE